MSEILDRIMSDAERVHQLIMDNQSTEATAILRIARAINAERVAERGRCNEIVRAAWNSGLSIEAFEAALKNQEQP